MIDLQPVLFLSSIVFLKSIKSKGLYVLGCFTNACINIVLKAIIQQKRPGNYKSFIPFDNFGMPSGHAQFAAFSTIYISTLKNKNLTLVYLLCWLFILIQRVVQKYHTMEQVVVGSIVGVIVAKYYLQIVSLPREMRR